MREELSEEELALFDILVMPERDLTKLLPVFSTADLGDFMRLKIDKDNDVLFFRLDEAGIAGSEEVQPGVILDFNTAGEVVGIELLNLST